MLALVNYLVLIKTRGLAALVKFYPARMRGHLMKAVPCGRGRWRARSGSGCEPEGVEVCFMSGHDITVKLVHSLLQPLSTSSCYPHCLSRARTFTCLNPYRPIRGTSPCRRGQLYSLRTAIARFACASIRRSPHRLFCYKPRFRVGARYLSADHFRIRSFRKRGFYLKNPMRLLRILSFEAHAHRGLLSAANSVKRGIYA